MKGKFPKPAEARHGHRGSENKRLRVVHDGQEPARQPVKRRALHKLRPDGGEWHAMTKRWWSDAWLSPAAPYWTDLDFDGLVMLATIADEFHREPKPAYMAELRLSGERYGLGSPMAAERFARVMGAPPDRTQDPFDEFLNAGQRGIQEFRARHQAEVGGGA